MRQAKIRATGSRGFACGPPGVLARGAVGRLKALGVTRFVEVGPDASLVGAIEEMDVLAVPADLPAKDLREFVALAKSKPGALNYGSTGVGAASAALGFSDMMTPDSLVFRLNWSRIVAECL